MNHERGRQAASPGLTAGALVLLLTLSACAQKMGENGHARPLSPDPLSPGQSIARQPPEGTVARGQLALSQPGPIPNRNPLPVTLQLLKRGQERFNIYCSPCHGFTGAANGMIVQRGFLAPPSYHIDRLRSAPDSHFFDVITNGYGAMYSYRNRVSVPDRWAITAYIRALQLSQNVSATGSRSPLSADDKRQLEELPK